MKNIFAIGGLNAGSDMHLIESKIINAARVDNPKILYMPTAGGDALKNFNLAKSIFKEVHHCDTTPLLLINQEPDFDSVRRQILSSDIVFIGGGNVKTLMSEIEKHHLQAIFEEALEQGVVMAGMSAGGLCWGKSYLTNSDEVLDCMNHIKMPIYPHYNKASYQDTRRRFEAYLKSHHLSGLAIDNNVALHLQGDTFRVISSEPEAKAYILAFKNNKLIKKILKNDGIYRPLSELRMGVS